MAIVDKEQRKSSVISEGPLEDDVRRKIKKFVHLKLVEGKHIAGKKKGEGKTPREESDSD
jgi:hypothetical protein